MYKFKGFIDISTLIISFCCLFIYYIFNIFNLYVNQLQIIKIRHKFLYDIRHTYIENRGYINYDFKIQHDIMRISILNMYMFVVNHNKHFYYFIDYKCVYTETHANAIEYIKKIEVIPSYNNNKYNCILHKQLIQKHIIEKIEKKLKELFDDKYSI